jgi:hypothetical protein
LYACHSLQTRDAADALRVLSVGVDVAPALTAQGHDASALINRIWDACQKNGGDAAVAAADAAAIQNVAHVLRIGWVAEACEPKARIICTRSVHCPRERRCDTSR